VGRTIISFTSTSAGCSIADAIARAIASGERIVALLAGILFDRLVPIADLLRLATQRSRSGIEKLTSAS
jgi:hypothetical protein